MDIFENRFDLLLSKIDTMNANLEKNNNTTSIILNELKIIKGENQEMKHHIEALNERCDRYETEIKKKNLLFDLPPTIMPNSQSNLETTILSVVNKILKVGVTSQELECVYEIKLKHPKQFHRIFVQLTSYKRKLEIVRSRSNLKGTDIYIREDFTMKTLMQRKELLPLLNSERSKGVKAVLRFNKLVTPDQIFYYDMDEKMVKSFPNRVEGRAKVVALSESSSEHGLEKEHASSKTPTPKKRRITVRRQRASNIRDFLYEKQPVIASQQDVSSDTTLNAAIPDPKNYLRNANFSN